MRTRNLIVAILASGALAAPGSSGALGTPAIVSGPGDTYKTFTVPVAVAQKGDDVVFAHLDPTGLHDVVSTTQFGPDDAAHCFARNFQFPALGGVYDPTAATFRTDSGGNRIRAFPVGKCPMLFTELLVVGQRYPIEGLENVVAGTVYDFRCTKHPNMFGKIVIAP